MTRRRFGLVLALAALAPAGCGGATLTRHVPARTPTVLAPPGGGITCLVAVPTCTIHPCIEFVAPPPKVAVPQPKVGVPAPKVGVPQPKVGVPQPKVGGPAPLLRCSRYPSPRGRVVVVRR